MVTKRQVKDIIKVLVFCIACGIVYSVFKSTEEKPYRIGRAKISIGFKHVRNKDVAGKSLFIMNKTVPDTTKPFSYEGEQLTFIWRNLCGTLVDDLRYYALFPSYPDEILKQRGNLHLDKINSANYGQRTVGLLTPPVTGLYKFALYSDDSSEFWLSSNDTQEHLEEAATVGNNQQSGWTSEGELDKYSSQKSKPFNLAQGNKYYFELLFKQGVGDSHFGLLWKGPDSNKYEAIQNKYFLPINIAISELLKHRNNAHTLRKSNTSSFSVGSQLLEHKTLANVLQVCEYNPSYLVRERIKQFTGVYHDAVFSVNTQIYPADETSLYVKTCNVHKALCKYDCVGNRHLEEAAAKMIINEYMVALHIKFQRRYSLEKIIRVENRPDKKKGDRYFLELQLFDSVKKHSVYLAEYAFKPKGLNKSLCHPVGINWNHNAMVNIVTTAKQQPCWLQYLISQVSKIYLATGDENINLIIVDYGNDPIDLEASLKRSPIPRYKIIKKTGKFYKTEAIQEAAATVVDPNEIIFQLDLHIALPVNLIDLVRKHCVQGKITFTPILLRLDKNKNLNDPAGRFETMGYGLFGMFKSDWDVIGGMNTTAFKTSWGGEDWDLLDRVLMKGYEVDRFRLPDLFHFFHIHKVLWDGKRN